MPSTATVEVNVKIKIYKQNRGNICSTRVKILTEDYNYLQEKKIKLYPSSLTNSSTDF